MANVVILIMELISFTFTLAICTILNFFIPLVFNIILLIQNTMLLARDGIAPIQFTVIGLINKSAVAIH